jgi:hypothetical protein
VDEGLGGKFWFKLIGIVILAGIGAIIFFSLIVLVWGWIYDKRHEKEYERLRAEA